MTKMFCVQVLHHTILCNRCKSKILEKPPGTLSMDRIIILKYI